MQVAESYFAMGEQRKQRVASRVGVNTDDSTVGRPRFLGYTRANHGFKQAEKEKHEASLLLRLEPGDAGYIGWSLALKEYYLAVTAVLREYEGVEEEETRRANLADDESDDDDDVDEDVTKLVDMLAECPYRYRLM